MYSQASENGYVHIPCTLGQIWPMEYEEKRRLARTGDADKPAAAARLRAARAVTGLSQEGLGRAGGVKKAAVSNAEKGLAFPNRDILVYLFREHRIDFNFMIHGDFAQLPGDVQDQLFAALEAAEHESDRAED